MLTSPPGVLRYTTSSLEWATAQLIAERPSWARRAFLYLLLLVLGSGLVYAHFARVAVVVEAPGALEPSQGLFPLKAPVSFSVEELRVADNQVVSVGQILIVAKDQLSEDEATGLLAEAQGLERLLERDRTHQCEPCVRELRAIAEQGFASANSGPIREPLAGLRQTLRLTASQREAYANRGAALRSAQRKIQIASEKIAEIKRQNAMEMLALKVEQLNSEIVAAKAELAEREQGAKGNLERAKSDLVGQVTELASLISRYRSEREIKAPVAGTVINAKVKGPGQLVAVGELLLEIVPLDARIVAGLDVANRDISKIRPDMRVRLKLDALPEREYGPVEGKISNVPVVNLAADGSGAPATGAYRVLVELDRQGLERDGVHHPFRIGMSLRGLVIVRYESMLSRVFKALFQIKDELVPESA